LLGSLFLISGVDRIHEARFVDAAGVEMERHQRIEFGLRHWHLERDVHIVGVFLRVALKEFEDLLERHRFGVGRRVRLAGSSRVSTPMVQIFLESRYLVWTMASCRINSMAPCLDNFMPSFLSLVPLALQP